MYGHALNLLSRCWCGEPATALSDKRGGIKVCAKCALREERKEQGLVCATTAPTTAELAAHGDARITEQAGGGDR